jgi:hypothetical protein
VRYSAPFLLLPRYLGTQSVSGKINIKEKNIYNIANSKHETTHQMINLMPFRPLFRSEWIIILFGAYKMSVFGYLMVTLIFWGLFNLNIIKSPIYDRIAQKR